ncbi:MAG: type II toxin-antitoxin system prevent-host-death family antitoxin [Bacillota bacterium]|nr:type II toxin-antitoxin system prevent-host-death family antitoxin [Bacillota bacterium]
MIVNATEFKNKVGKYLEIVNRQEEVIISRNGKQIAKLIPIDKPSTPNVDGLLELLNKGKKGEDIDLSKMREERLRKYESLT